MPDEHITFLDLDGTIFQKSYSTTIGNVAPSIWPAIAESLGEKCAEEVIALRDKWNAGRYESYVHWARETVELHRRHGLTRETFEKVTGSVKYNEGIPELIAALHDAGHITAIVSGGFAEMGRRAQRELGIDYVFTACDYHWNPDGSLRGCTALGSDYEGKAAVMSVVAMWHGKMPGECNFIGDGINDQFAMQAARKAIALNGDRRLATYREDIHFVDGDARAALPYLLTSQ